MPSEVQTRSGARKAAQSLKTNTDFSRGISLPELSRPSAWVPGQPQHLNEGQRCSLVGAKHLRDCSIKGTGILDVMDDEQCHKDVACTAQVHFSQGFV